MGDGGKIPNLGQKQINLTDPSLDSDVQSIGQIAAVTRPLMSGGTTCHEAHDITFNQLVAFVRNRDGDELCRSHRASGGLYVAKLKLTSPAGFGGQG